MIRRLFARPAVARHGTALMVATVLAVVSGCASTPRPPAPEQNLMRVGSAASASVPAPARFTFGVGDEFDVRVPDATQFDLSAKVRPDGKISLPLVGTVHVQGRTPEDVQRELEERFAQLAGGGGERDYLLRPNDDIEIKFVGHPELAELVKIRPDGKIQLQYVGMVRVEGLSPEELESQLELRYAKWIKQPQLTVLVRAVTSQSIRVGAGFGRSGTAGLKPQVIVRSYQASQIFVGGEVARPGVLAYRPGLSLMQALVESGGGLASGDAQRLMLLRRGTDDKVEVIDAGFTAALLRSPDRDVLLQPFDIVLLPKSDTATLADNLNQYVFNLVPFIRNSSFGLSYNFNGYKY